LLQYKQNEDAMPVEASRERIGRLIQQVSRNWRRAVNLRMAPLGLTDATWLPLLYLNRVGSVRQGELADYLGLDRSSVVRLIDTLTAQGLLKREDDPDDRRAKRIVLTPAAAPVVRAAQEAATAVRATALEGLEPEALAITETVLASILSKLPLATEEVPT
jgi:MarR family transcriptional regulator, transcriptional regulator for hemolysin